MVIVVVFVLVVILLVYKLVLSSLVIKLISLKDEFGVLKNKLVWFIFGIIFIGFGGVFCIYIYLVDMILVVIEMLEYIILIVMMMFGIGIIIGNWVCGKLVDKLFVSIIGIVLLCSVVIVVLYV